MTRHVAALVLAFTTCATTTVIAEDGPASGVPELEVLSNYSGTWDVAISTKDSPFTKGEATATWILDGRFLQQTGSVTSADGATILKITTLMTYDQEANAYRMWSFLSNGASAESSGTWDATTRTMTSVRRENDSTTTTTAKFTNDGHEEWKIVTTSQKNGEVLSELSGTNTRRDR